VAETGCSIGAAGDGVMDLLPLSTSARDGLLLGGVYAIVAVGLTMTFGVLRIVNFAHGDFLASALSDLSRADAARSHPYLSLFLVLPLVALAPLLPTNCWWRR